MYRRDLAANRETLEHHMQELSLDEIDQVDGGSIGGAVLVGLALGTLVVCLVIAASKK